jgi:hypothetical protein
MRSCFRLQPWPAGALLSACLWLMPSAALATECELQPCYRDADGDGVGNTASYRGACVCPVGYVGDGGDCNDADASIGAKDTYFLDNDRDGYGAGASQFVCSAPGWSWNNADCNDSNAAVNPGTQKTCGSNACTYNSVPSCLNGTEQTCYPKTPPAETCDGQDNNCDGRVDNMAALGCGTGECRRFSTTCDKECITNEHGATQCYWSRTECLPGLPTAETCDGVDNDCNGHVDNNPGLAQANTFTQSCNPNACTESGNQTCTNGVLSACTGCGGYQPCLTARCGEPSGTPCNFSCQLTASVCAELAHEVCNDCDDTGEGGVDEALSCQPHDF